MIPTPRLLAAAALLGLTAASAQAVVTITTTTAASFTVSNTDLLQTSMSSYTGDGFLNSGGQTTFLNALAGAGITVGSASLTDGVWYNHNPSNPAFAGNTTLTAANTESRGSAVTSNDVSAEYGLNLGASSLGYDITQIDLFSNWGNGDGRNEIRVTISYSLVGDANFSTLTNPDDMSNLFVYQPVAVASSVDGTQGKMSINGLELTGVDAIRFDFPSNQENGGVGYSEIDVIGSAVPEPSAALLGGVGLLALLRRRRK